MNARITLISGAVCAGLAVGLGAFGAHALKPVLLQSGRAETYELAVRYQFYHSIALCITGLLLLHYRHKLLRGAAWCFLTGIMLFSGSLYLLSLSGITILGAVTPFGGVLLLTGWISLVISFLKTKSLRAEA
jgi:uncharacterized membrane protein YgdD (TMEM256/DUF423 family)